MFVPYKPNEIEPKWQKYWEEIGLYRTTASRTHPKYYCLDFFPYPSGEGLHVGHCRNYLPSDVISRVRRMQGFNVLHPMGWDAFGEPAEQYAIAHHVHPRTTTNQNTANYRRQLSLIGASYDWTREIDSSRPEYYRWTQWIFLLMYQRGLAYRDKNWQWWCPTCQTTLSSHEAVGGVCWRGHQGVRKREIPAWYFRITAYADELIAGLDEIDWPESIKAMQRNWIGRSDGWEVIFQTEAGLPVPVYTTRPDTIFGVTYLVIAPEHPLASLITTDEQRQVVEAYQSEVNKYSEIERMLDDHEKTGVFTGAYVIHPFRGDKIPVWIADYILPSYGSGAVMGVPAHDERDYAFASAHALPITPVVVPPDYCADTLSAAYTGSGILINSSVYDGMTSIEAMECIGKDLEQRGLAIRQVQYRMRDWLISRQRYWGTPIPIIHCERCGEVPVNEEQLPILLPDMEDYQPNGSGRSSLARHPDFVHTTCPKCGMPAQRETDTMGGFACSSWYFLRFTSPHETKAPFDQDAVRYWMPVDLYIGGAEHAVLHLLYARFWTKVLADAGLLPFREPFIRLKNQGQLLGLDGHRMSKSRGNTITPDSMVEQYGADALRIYSLFMAPFDQDIAWSTEGIIGAQRFLNRVWKLYQDTYEDSEMAQREDIDLLCATHRMIHQVSERIDGFRFNTVISALMEFISLLDWYHRTGSWHTVTFHRALDTFLILLAPVAPHITEELWRLTGHGDSVHQQMWPKYDPALAQEDAVELPIQVDGKVRDVIVVPTHANQSEVELQVKESSKVQQCVADRRIVKIIYVPGKIFSIVTG